MTSRTRGNVRGRQSASEGLSHTRAMCSSFASVFRDNLARVVRLSRCLRMGNVLASHYAPVRVRLHLPHPHECLKGTYYHAGAGVDAELAKHRVQVLPCIDVSSCRRRQRGGCTRR